MCSLPEISMIFFFVSKESAWQCRRCKRLEFDPWVGKISWRREWQSTPVFLPGESHGQRILAKSQVWLSNGHRHYHFYIHNRGQCRKQFKPYTSKRMWLEDKKQERNCSIRNTWKIITEHLPKPMKDSSPGISLAVQRLRLSTSTMGSMVHPSVAKR